MLTLLTLGTWAAFAAESSGAPASALAATGLSVEQRAKIDALFKEYDTAVTPGCALGVLRNGHLAYARGYGMADLERRVRITRATLFDIASASKQFTAGAVLLLELDGKLALSDDVRKYVPELPDYGAPITIDQLMRHTSGLRDYIGLLQLAGLDWGKDVVNNEQTLAIIARQRQLNFPSGSRHEYSNTGYFLLSVIVQRVSGKSLADFARERIFLPLGMIHSRFQTEYTMIIPDRALGYAADDKGGFRQSLSGWEQTGDGSLHLSIEEALQWDENFYQPRIGGRVFAERLQETGTLPNGGTFTYARGLMVDKYRGLIRVHHGGAWIGYRSMLARFPEQHTSVAVFCNFEGSDAGRLSDRVADIVLTDVLAAAEPSPAAPPAAGAQPTVLVDSTAHQRFLGSYFVAESDAGLSDTVFEVTQGKGALMLKIGSTSLPLTPAGPATFTVPGGSTVRVEFSVAAQGSASALRLRLGGGSVTTATRIALATPSAADLQAYTGTFYSPELDATWPVVVDDGHLTVRRETQKFVVEPLELKPAMADTFNGEHGLLRFTRDPSGRVTGFDLSSARMRGIRFEPRPRL